MVYDPEICQRLLEELDKEIRQISPEGLKKNTIPFNVKELGKLTDSEFYLIVIGHEEKEKMAKRIGESNVIDGSLSQIISRSPRSLEYYLLGDLREVVLEDGTPLGKSINTAFGHYILKIEDFQLREGQPPILKGVVTPYDVEHNSVGKKLEEKVILYMNEVPVKKTKYSWCVA